MGLEFDYFSARDGLTIRWGFGAATAPCVCGTVLLLNGRTEYMEKYGEVIGELNQRGFDVYSCDWRGQGLSARMLVDRHKGHVLRFEDYLDDLATLVAIVQNRCAPEPYLLLGHSMGGHLSVRFLALRPDLFFRAVLTSPMIDIQLPRFLPRQMLRWLVGTALRAGLQEAYVPGSGGWQERDGRFPGNCLTSDRARFARNVTMIHEDPRLALGGVTYGWLAAALLSIDCIAAPGFAASLGVPVLMVTAGEDRIVCPKAQAQFCRGLRDGRMLCIRGARHELLVETDDRRAQFWQAWDRFIDPA
jgi:lysophospholipase